MFMTTLPHGKIKKTWFRWGFDLLIPDIRALTGCAKIGFIFCGY